VPVHATAALQQLGTSFVKAAQKAAKGPIFVAGESAFNERSIVVANACSI
jgi:hypothetical protein